ncbi:hypothetical protein ACHAPT_004551 [Fusarium lateritium]
MSPNRNTSASGQPASADSDATPMRQTRARSRLVNAPRLMRGLDHRGRPVDPLSTDPENIVFDDVVKQLKDRRKKVIFRPRSKSPDSPTDNVKAAKRAQLKKKAPADLSVAAAASSASQSPSSDSSSDGGVPLTARSSSSSSSSSDSDGGVPLNSPSSSSGSGSSPHGSSTSSHSSGSSSSSGSPSSERSSQRSGSPHPSEASGSESPSHDSGSPRPSEASSSSDSSGGGSMPPPPPPTPQTSCPQGGGHVPLPSPGSQGGFSHQANRASAYRGTPLENGHAIINSPPPFAGEPMDESESQDGFSSSLSASSTKQSHPDAIVSGQADEELATIDMSGGDIAVTSQRYQSMLSDEGEDESPRTPSRSVRSSCSVDSFRKRRRSEDDGSAPQAFKKPRVSEDEVLYSPTFPIPVTEQSDINPCPSPEPTFKIPGLAFLEPQHVSITTGNANPMVLTPCEPPADFDGEIPGIYGSGKRPRLEYDYYEQYHLLGPDCEKVHACEHGKVCHQCHADWHMAWFQYFKLKDAIDAEIGEYDIRKGYLGTALGPEHAQMLAFEPIRPPGGKLRTHPARVAKEKLALMMEMAAKTC